ncbi:hypothetical protein CVT25_000572, partial [Psilocybe cyanescens]
RTIAPHHHRFVDSKTLLVFFTEAHFASDNDDPTAAVYTLERCGEFSIYQLLQPKLICVRITPVSLTIFHALAIISTGLRLEHRRRTKKLWWDDLVTVVPIMLEGLNITILWLRIRDHRDTPLKYRILMSYGNTVCFTTILWYVPRSIELLRITWDISRRFSRISLAFAVVRITPSWTKSRRIAIWLTITLIFFWLGLLLYLILTCTIHNEWQHAKTDVLICPPKRHVSVGFTAFDVVSDLALVAIPLNLLWNMNHASSQRRLVRLVFSASVLTLLASLCLCIVAYAGFMEGPGALLLWSMVCYILCPGSTNISLGKETRPTKAMFILRHIGPEIISFNLNG